MLYGLFGNFGHSNLGDEAILVGMTSLLKSNDKNLVVFTDNIDNSLEMFGDDFQLRKLREPFAGELTKVPAILFQIFKSVMKVDVVIIGGGGLFNQINKSAFYQYLFIMFVSLIGFKKLIIAGVSVGPLESAWMKGLLKLFSLKASTILVRDESSLANFFNSNKEVIPDIALAHKEKGKPNAKPTSTLAISVMDISKSQDKELHKEYEEKIALSIDAFLKNSEFDNIVLFCMDREKDFAVANSITNMLDNDLVDKVRIKEINSVKEIGAFIETADFVIGTRLHASILSVAHKKNFLAVGYQEKVNKYFISSGLKDNLIEITEFLNVDLVQKVKTLNNGDALEKVKSYSDSAFLNLHSKFKAIL